MSSRDDKLSAAVREFFKDDGDIHEFKHVVREAIRSMDIVHLGMTPRLYRVLTKDVKVQTIGELEDMPYNRLLAEPGIGHTYARVLKDALAQVSANQLFK